MLLNLLALLFGVSALWVGTEMALRRVPRLAKSIGVSPLTVTVLFLAVLTSLPELCVSLFAALRGQASAALGNIVGSNLVTLTFVTAICALWRPVDVSDTIRERESSWMILGSSLLLLLALDGRVSRTDGAVLVLAYCPYLIVTLRDAGQQRRERDFLAKRCSRLDYVLILAGLGMVVAGANFVVRCGTSVARSFGMSDLLIGITFFAFGTSLPELAIALGAAVKGEGDVTLGETYASNIFTGMVVTGIIAMAHPLNVEPMIVQLDLPILVLSGVILQMFITSGRRLIRFEALGMITLYAIFLLAHFFGFHLELP